LYDGSGLHPLAIPNHYQIKPLIPNALIAETGLSLALAALKQDIALAVDNLPNFEHPLHCVAPLSHFLTILYHTGIAKSIGFLRFNQCLTIVLRRSSGS